MVAIARVDAENRRGIALPMQIGTPEHAAYIRHVWQNQPVPRPALGEAIDWPASNDGQPSTADAAAIAPLLTFEAREIEISGARYAAVFCEFVLVEEPEPLF